MTPLSGHAGLHVRYEKAGLILDALPIPWNADAVIVEANVRLPKDTPRDKQDFSLRWSDADAGTAAELIMAGSAKTPTRVFFRVRKPTELATAKVYWRESLLGQVDVPVTSRADAVDNIAMDLPTLHVTLGGKTVACNAFVSGQAKHVFASAVLRSPTPLAAIDGLDLRVTFSEADGEPIDDPIRVSLTPEQMRQRQALVAVTLPRPRTLGAYEITWWLASRRLHMQRLRVVSKTALRRSLRISRASFMLEFSDGTSNLVRALPEQNGTLSLDGVDRVTPVFYVTSSEAGIAALADFTLRALVGDLITTMKIHNADLVTDGVQPIVLGSVAAEDLPNIRHFTLASGDKVLGNLPLVAAPRADLTAEGGFAPEDDYLWSPAAEEQLQDRLGKLLDEE
jgi:hypothetical protein